MFNIKAALISALSIPISLLLASILTLSTGTSLNIMVIAGLAIALGEVVDDAIIDVENILRRLRENTKLKKGARVVLHKVQHPEAFGVAKVDKKNRIYFFINLIFLQPK